MGWTAVTGQYVCNWIELLTRTEVLLDLEAGANGGDGHVGYITWVNSLNVSKLFCGASQIFSQRQLSVQSQLSPQCPI